MKTTKKCPRCNTELADDTVEGLCPKCLIKQAIDSNTKTVIDDSAGTTTPTVVIPSMPAVDLVTITGLFPQLEIIELLGQGGMGVVYKARQPQLDRIVALKILLPEVGKDPQFAERFGREARALAKLNHPNIVAVYDFGQVDSLYYFIMEYVDGTNLRQMERKEKLSSAQALGIIPKICDALQYAHDEGVVHRDIKPENILVDKKGRIKIADFGLAKLVGKTSTDFSLTMSNMVMGTPHYMAPEQVEHPTEVDHRADIYSLGVVLYEMLTGELPIGRFALPSQKVQVDVRLDEVVIRTLEKEPERRYQQVSEVKSRVETISGSAMQYAAVPVGAGQTVTSAPADVSANVKNMARNAGVLMIIGGALLMFWAFLAGTMEIIKVMKYASPPMTELTFLVLLTLAGIGGYAIAGGAMFKRITNYGFVKSAVIIFLISPLLLLLLKGNVRNDMMFQCLLTLMFGTQALVTLRKPELKKAFGLSVEPQVGASRAELASRQVSGPATGLIVTAVVNWISLFVLLLIMFLYKHQSMALPFLPLLLAVILTAGSALILVGALKMKRMESYGMAKMASILSMIIGPGYLIGWPVGIWSLVVLSRPEVKAGFGISVAQKDEMPPSTGIGKTALWFSILGLILPVVLGMVVYIFRNSLKVDEVYLIVGCWLLGIVMELIALGCGIVARRTAQGKVGIIISIISLVLSVLVFLAVFTVGPVQTSGNTSPRETHGPATSFIKGLATSEAKATIVEAPDPADDPKEMHYRKFRYRIFSPINHRVSLWLEYWKEGEKIADQAWNKGYYYIPDAGKAIDSFFEFSLTEGKKLSPDAEGKVRWGWSMQLSNGSTSSGEWAPDPFYGGSVSFTSTWGKKGRNQRWDIEPGKPCTLLAMVGAKGSGHFTTDKDNEKYSSICILLRVRIDPVDVSNEKTPPGAGYFNDPDQFFGSTAVQK